MDLVQIAQRLEELSDEHEIPELQGLANELSKAENTGTCDNCERNRKNNEEARRALTEIVVMIARTGAIEASALERLLYDAQKYARYGDPRYFANMPTYREDYASARLFGP